MLLSVVVRTCVKTGVPTNKQRLVNDSRDVLVSKCIKSLAEACKNVSGMDLEITLLDDGSDEVFVNRFAQYFHGLEYELIELGGVGFNDSAVMQFNTALHSDGDFLYLVEDDYFHAPNAIQTMIDGYFYLRNFSSIYDTAIFPFDAPDRYFRDPLSPSLITQHLGYHWRTMTHTSNTLFISKPSFERMHPLFDRLARGYGNDKYEEHIVEDTTINRMWSNLTNKHGNIALWSPIPSLALHMSFEDIPEINTNLTQWKTEWSNYET